MLFLHETHKVVGAREDEFEAAYREGWMPTLAQGDDARLLWYTNHAHGSGLGSNRHLVGKGVENSTRVPRGRGPP